MTYGTAASSLHCHTSFRGHRPPLREMHFRNWDILKDGALRWVSERGDEEAQQQQQQQWSCASDVRRRSCFFSFLCHVGVDWRRLFRRDLVSPLTDRVISGLERMAPSWRGPRREPGAPFSLYVRPIHTGKQHCSSSSCQRQIEIHKMKRAEESDKYISCPNTQFIPVAQRWRRSAFRDFKCQLTHTKACN